MKRSSHMRDLVIGLVFLGGLVILGVASLKVTNLPFFGRPRYVTVPFQEVAGVRIGDDVLFHGFNVGIVSDIQPTFDQATKVNLHCRLNQAFRLPEDSVFEVRSAGPLGGSIVEIVPGSSQRMVAIDEGSFRGNARGDLFEKLGGLVDDIGANLTDSIAELRQITRSINEAEGVIGALIKDPALRDRVSQAIDDLAEAARALRQSDGTLGMLINDSETRDRVKSAITSIEDISLAIKEGRGTIGKLINEPDLYNDLKETVAGVRRIVGEVESGEGALSMLLRDPEVKQSLKNSIEYLEETLKALGKEGEGTAAMLVHDKEVPRQVRRILVQVEDAIEDFREQAPISTFVSAIFQAF